MANARTRSLSTREIVVLVASALLLVASFMSVSSDFSYRPWHQATLPLLVLGYLAGVAVGVLVALEVVGGPRGAGGPLGLTSEQLLGVLATVSFVMLLLTLLSGGGAGAGLLLAVIASLVLVVVVVFGDRIPALAGH